MAKAWIKVKIMRKGMIKILIVGGLVVVACVTGLVIAGSSKERPGVIFEATSDWRQMVDGRSEKKGARDFLPKEELDWIMRHEKVSKEEILEYAKQYIEYRKGQIKEYYAQDEKGIPESISTQVTRLEGIIKTLEEE